MTPKKTSNNRFLLHLIVLRKNNQIEEMRSRTDSTYMAESFWNGWTKFLEEAQIQAYKVVVYDQKIVWLKASSNPRLLNQNYDPGHSYPEFLSN